MAPSLLAHVVLTSPASTENCTTEALAYILGNYKAAADSFERMLQGTGLPIPNDLRYQTQRDLQVGGTPDIYCSDGAGIPRLLIENKFDAELTKHQPDSYLEAGAYSQALIVLLLVPEHRARTIWGELSGKS